MKLYPYQEVGRDFLVRHRLALLADEMGLGKTVQTITAADALNCRRLLVLCPAVARENWREELRRFSPSRHVRVLETQKDDRSGDCSLVCSYDLATDIAAAGKWINSRFDILVLDEAHFLKSVAAERTQKILGKGGLRMQCRRIWALTGTPMPNHPGELWPLLKTFGATTLAFDAFVERFCISRPGYRNKPIITGMNRSRTDELRKMLSPFMLQRTAEQVGLELPPLTFGDVTVAAGEVFVTDELRARAEAQESWLRQRLTGTDYFAPNQMALLEAVAQSVASLRLYNGLQKVESVSDLVSDELEARHYKKIIIFGIHRSVINGLVDRLFHRGAVSISGDTSTVDRVKNVKRFQEDPDCQVIVCNIKAAGTAINLTAADHVLFCESEWSPGDNRQALKRAHRIGRTRPVFVRFASIAGSIDGRIQTVNRRKASDIEALFAA